MTSLPNIDDIAKKIAEQENIIDPIIEHQYKGSKGEGYIGLINAIELRGKNKTLNLIVKCAPNNEKVRKDVPITAAFQNEILFYDKRMPAFYKMQNEYDIKNKFDGVPKCYATVATVPNELLILENLKTQGYELWDRKKEMNFAHVEFVFREYGKFHALSYALKEKHPKVFEEVTAGQVNCSKTFLENAEGIFVKSCKELLTMFDPVKDKELMEIFGDFGENIVQKYNSTLEVDEYATALHGDCWCNNMMFKYNGDSTDTPSSMRLLDFQVGIVGSPVLDLSFFFYSCASKAAIDNLERFQNAYHASLTSHLKQFGLDAEKIYPHAAFQNHWKKYSKLGLVMAPVAIKVMTCDSDETPDFSELAEKNDGSVLEQAFSFKSRHEEEYRRRMNNVIRHFYENKFI